MTKRIQATSDLAFKKAFGSLGNEDVLQGMIGDFFGIHPQIEDITITAGYSIEAYEEYVKRLQGNEEISEKLRQTVRDVSADIKFAGFGAEVQVRSDIYFSPRSIHYLCDRFCSNYNLTGKMVQRYDGKYIRYSSLKPVYTLNVLGYTHFPGDDDALRVFTLYDRVRDKAFETEYLTIAYFELGKNNVETTNQRHWRTYFKTGEAPDEAPEYIKKAARIIERANMTQKERDMIDQLQRAEDIYDSVIYTAQIEGERIGEARGEARGRIEGEKAKELAIALKALHMGMSVAEAAKLTGATEDEIRKLAH